MSKTQQIRQTIASTQNTGKITNAMRLVASSKLKKTQDRAEKTKPYVEKIQEIIGHIALSSSEYRHPFMQSQRAIKRVGYIIISTDRGLCGGLNNNLFKNVVGELQRWHKENVEVDLCLVGNKASIFFKNLSDRVVAKTSHLGDSPQVADLIGVVKVMLDSYEQGSLDQVFVASNRFLSVMVQQPVISQLLPIVPKTDLAQPGHWDYIYEPDAKALLDVLFTRYIEALVYGSLIENIACEQAARMIAMQNATDNGKQIINELRLIYNKARQSAITQELTEIIAGAEAV